MRPEKGAPYKNSSKKSRPLWTAFLLLLKHEIFVRSFRLRQTSPRPVKGLKLLEFFYGKHKDRGPAHFHVHRDGRSDAGAETSG